MYLCYAVPRSGAQAPGYRFAACIVASDERAMAGATRAFLAPCSPRRSVETGADSARDRLTPIESCAGRASAPGRSCLRCDVRHLALCAALGEDELPHLEAIVSVVSLGPGRALFGEGDPVRHVYNVAVGPLRLFKLLPDGRRQITGFGLAGDFVGLVAGGKHPFWAEAVIRFVLCQLPTQLLRAIAPRLPEMEHRLLDMRDVELVAAQDRMVLLGRKTPMEKIATFLLEISARQEGWGWPASPVTLSMTRGDIADYPGLP